MNKNDFDLLGDKHKKYEAMTGSYLLPGVPFVIRLDGRAFHTFTKGMKRPYDIRLSTAMAETAIGLVSATSASVGYAQSDEITLGFPNLDLDNPPMFSGRVQKICSIVAAVASVRFNNLIRDTIPEKIHMEPVFDARVIQYPNLELAAESFLWRETDATRNSLSMLAQYHFTQKELQGKSAAKQHDLIHSAGDNWNNYPAFFKRGTYVGPRKIEKFLTLDELSKIPEINRPTGPVIRNVIADLHLEPYTTIQNIIGVLFNKENPIQKN